MAPAARAPEEDAGANIWEYRLDRCSVSFVLGFAVRGGRAIWRFCRFAWTGGRGYKEETIELPLTRDVDAPIAMLPARHAVSIEGCVSEHVPAIKSEIALVVDQDTNEILMQKNPDEVSSIASITKLMTAIITLDAGLPLDEQLQVRSEDRTTAGWSGSSLRPGVHLTRAQALHLALMSSENHAAQLLGRTYPGGVAAAVAAMNAKAHQIGMNDSIFADPTGSVAAKSGDPE